MTFPRNTWIEIKTEEAVAGQLDGGWYATKELVTFRFVKRLRPEEGVRCRRDNREL